MSKLAMLTSGPMLSDISESERQTYYALAQKIFANLGRDDGFLGQIAPEEWDTDAIPTVYHKPDYAPYVIQTLSLWHDFESLHAFSYNSHHLQALKQTEDWFPKFAWRNHVIWWVDDDHTPTWSEAVERFNQLREKGNAPAHFDFGHLYDAEGQPAELNRAITREKANLYR